MDYFGLTQITCVLNGHMRVRPKYDPNPLSPNPNPLTSCRVRGSCQILPPLGMDNSIKLAATKVKVEANQKEI